MRFARSKKRPRKSPLGGRRRRMFRIKMVLLFLVVVVILGVFWKLLRLPEVVVEDISISGNTITKTEELRTVIEEELSGTYFFFIPKNSEFFLPRHSIEKEIISRFPRIESAEASLQGGDALLLEVSERTPHALWCGDVYLNTEDELGHCYFMDDTSFVFAKAPDFTGNIFFKYFGALDDPDFSASSSPLGHVYMQEADFSGLEVFLEAFKELGYIPVSFAKIGDGDVSVRMKSGVEILYGRDMRLAVVLDNLQSVLESNAFSNIAQEDVEYIDLRFGSKVYYKLRGGERVGG